MCAGAAIHPRFVITTAFCAANYSETFDSLQIFIGSQNYSQGLNFRIAALKTHEKYKPFNIEPTNFWSYNLGLIKLENAIPEENLIKLTNREEKNGEFVQVCGELKEGGRLHTKICGANRQRFVGFGVVDANLTSYRFGSTIRCNHVEVVGPRLQRYGQVGGAAARSRLHTADRSYLQQLDIRNRPCWPTRR